MSDTVNCTSCGRSGVPGTGSSCWVCYGAPEQDPEYMAEREEYDRQQWEAEKGPEPDWNDEERQKRIEREGQENDLAEKRRDRR